MQASHSQSMQADYESKEGFDYATQVLSSPWDMSEFTDISQWLNHAGSSNHLLNIQVHDGIFSATTAGGYSEFFPLFPGYEPGLLMGKIGARYPINSNRFSCFSMAMYSQWDSTDANYFNVFWAPSRAIGEWVDPSKVWGIAYGNKSSNGVWKLYRMNLNQPVALQNDAWSQRAEWQALRITPSLKAGVDFAVDWIRLTDCQPVFVTLSNLPAGAYSISLGIGQPERRILIAEGVSPDGNGSLNLDIQGVEPGAYQYYVTDSNDGGQIRSGRLMIHGSPIITFHRPSPFSGQDYTTRNGNAWDFSTSSDVQSVKCASFGIENGLLTLDTSSPNGVPESCVGSGANEMDPNVFLNTPSPTNIPSYRYLSFHHRIDGAWSVPESGMIVRWIWKVDMSGKLCEFVSREIPLDVGWSVYTVDLTDDWNGMPIQATNLPQCNLVAWKNENRSVVGFRIDPNENITDSAFHQELDWIRLTKVDQVTQGHPYPIKILLNKPIESLQSINFYYTTSLEEPAQNLAKSFQPNLMPEQIALRKIFLPLTITLGYDPFVSSLTADYIYNWDTADVPPGEYFICVEADDGFNQSGYCGEAPVLVISS